MPRIYMVSTGETIAEASADDVDFLVAALEEEHEEDQDYYVHRPTLAHLRELDGAPTALLAAIEAAMGDADEVDLAWE